MTCCSMRSRGKLSIGVNEWDFDSVFTILFSIVVHKDVDLHYNIEFLTISSIIKTCRLSVVSSVSSPSAPAPSSVSPIAPVPSSVTPIVPVPSSLSPIASVPSVPCRSVLVPVSWSWCARTQNFIRGGNQRELQDSGCEDLVKSDCRGTIF